MRHLTLVPQPAATPAATTAEPSPFEDPKVVALSFFQAASGICLCRECTMKRHPSYAAR